MFELLVVAAFLWLFIKGLGLAFRVTWGLTKAVAIVLQCLPCWDVCCWQAVYCC